MARRMLAVMLGLVLVTGVAASAALAQVTITFRYAFPDGDVIRDALVDFEKKNPGIKVNLQRSSFSEARDQLVREAAVGGGPDVAHLAFVWVQGGGSARDGYAVERRGKFTEDQTTSVSCRQRTTARSSRNTIPKKAMERIELATSVA
jgi:ABC-type glycerol-3-phosphate transport system substrate-binding protein